MPVQIPTNSAWTNQRLVLVALLHREAVTRFGKYKLGVLWMLVEPLVSVIVVGLVLGPLVGRTGQDMPYAFFLLNGMILLEVVTGSMTSAMGAIGANQGLLVFPKVQPLDLLLARFVFELMSALFSFVIFCLLGMWWGITLSLGSLHVLLACFLITWLMGCGMGLILAVTSAYFESVEKIYAFVRRPLIFVSCVLYPLYGLPDVAKQIVLWNPLVHTIEMSRKCLFPLYHVTDISLVYPTMCAIVVLAIGLPLFHHHRHNLSHR
ncbi:MAG: ABC transporter permease [Verrucomicrobiota bacterium]